jgi:mRNA (guanine-N7-)-methyltransferase
MNQTKSLSLEELLKNYLDSILITKTTKVSELEVRFSGEREVFNGKYKKTIGQKYTKVDYDNVIQKLRSFKFKTDNPEGADLMRIYVENVRVEIKGIHAIQHYCINENMDKLINDYPSSVEFQIKKPAKITIEGREINAYVENPDYNLKYVLSTEETVSNTSSMITNILQRWDDKEKFFRYINRLTLVHDDYPIKVDISIVKSSNKSYTLNGTDLFKKKEKYEIELEIDNSLIAKSVSVQELSFYIKKVIKYVLMGLQLTNYPISFTEIINVSKNYLWMIFGKDIADKQTFVYPKQFIGPSSITLQVENIVPLTEENNRIPNIRNNYIVTDKADGERSLLFINDDGKIYLINTNLIFIFTGSFITNKDYFNTLLDGEFISKDRIHNPINLYAAFDIYYLKGNDVCELPFKTEETKCRLNLLKNVIMNMNMKYISEDKLKQIKVVCKDFYDYNVDFDPTTIDEQEKIFTACSYLFDNIIPVKLYSTDGLIFTPKTFGVGGSPIIPVGPKQKITWDYSFKWKPPEFNTIDFLVITKKNERSDDLETILLQEGLNTTHSINQLQKYKTLGLFVGHDKMRNTGGMSELCNIIYKGEFNEMNKEKDDGNYNDYKPIQFNPIHPSDPDAGICNIMLNLNGEMVTEEHEIFSDNMIVEFRYDNTQDTKWKWKPLRVRYDKTARYKKGEKEYGNSFHVANSNWRSIQNKIDEEMIRGRDIPNLEENQDIYYNRITTSTYTQGLRDFHNLFVKKILIKSVSRKGNILIDYACGKAGDLSKWIEAELGFVFGMDISKDNIENRLDGACARFLSGKYTNKKLPDALFVQADSSKNIKDGNAFYSEVAFTISKSIFKECREEQSEQIGKYVKKHYGIGERGFNVSSCQFALHYFFKNVSTCNNFIKNVSQCTKVGGYFIGTCYDGKKLFNLLKDKEKITYYSDINQRQKILEIIKKYDQPNMENNETCLGYTISVFQESINKSFDEFLVNFDYFNRLMNDYGFQLIDKHEQNKYGFLEACGSFELLFQQMVNILRRDPEKSYGEAFNMTENEKKISFLNNYFIYKKVRDVDYRHIPFDEIEQKDEIEIKEIKEIKEVISRSKIIKKFKGKIILENAEYEIEDIPEKEKEEEEPIEEVKKTTKKRETVFTHDVPIEEEVTKGEPIEEVTKGEPIEKVQKVTKITKKREKKVFTGDFPIEEEVTKEPKVTKVSKKREKKVFTGDFPIEEEVTKEPIEEVKKTLTSEEVPVVEEPIVETGDVPIKKPRATKKKTITSQEVPVVEEPIVETGDVPIKKPRATKKKTITSQEVPVVEEPIVETGDVPIKKPRATKKKTLTGEEPTKETKTTKKREKKIFISDEPIEDTVINPKTSSQEKKITPDTKGGKAKKENIKKKTRKHKAK